MQVNSGSLVELVPTRLYYITSPTRELSDKGKQGVIQSLDSDLSVRFLCLQEELQPELLDYTGYHLDFGPLSLANMTKVSSALAEMCRSQPDCTVVVIPTDGANQQSSANIVVALGFFVITELSATADQLRADYFPHPVTSSFTCFHDASPHDDFLHLFDSTIDDVMLGLCKSVCLGLHKPSEFNVEVYEHLEQVENGDVNWIIPGLLLATSCPDEGEEVQRAAVFLSLGVGDIVQLNESYYDKSQLESRGITHHELIYEDGSVPELDMVAAFLKIVETALQNGSVVAVHCKAGLGRTGTMACCYLMHAYGFTAREAIGWCRVCRPGSVIGPQQQFLVWIEREMRMGKSFRTGDETVSEPETPPAPVVERNGHVSVKPFVPSPMLRRYSTKD